MNEQRGGAKTVISARSFAAAIKKPEAKEFWSQARAYRNKMRDQGRDRS